MAKYAVVNKETKVVTNIIEWDGQANVSIPDTEVWVEVPEDTAIRIKKTQYIDGQFQEPTE